MPASREWALRLSIKQRCFDVLLLILLITFVLFLSVPYWLVACLPVLFIALLGVWRVQKHITHIGFNQNQWYLIQSQNRVFIGFKAGCIKQEKMVRICWSIWPWRTLVLRPDSFISDGEFKEFKRALYGVF